MGERIDIQELARIDATPRPLWTWGAAAISYASFLLSPGTRLTFEGLEALPDEPVIVAMNHTNFYDFLALRAPLLFRGKRFVSWVKPRVYHKEPTGAFLKRAATIPLCSRGYVISCDFRDLFARAPSDQEYRRLRDHLDRGAPLPDEPLYERVQTEGRSILGSPFNPSRETWRGAVRRTYWELAELTVAETKRSVERGEHVHLYPEGSIAPRLGPGRLGVIHTALALDLPILAIGVSGLREALDWGGPFPKPGSRVAVRFGDRPYSVGRDGLPADFRPFHPADEDRHRAALEAKVEPIMGRIDALLDPAYQREPGAVYAERTGVARFL